MSFISLYFCTEIRALETKLKTTSPSPTAAKARITAMTSECHSVRCIITT